MIRPGNQDVIRRTPTRSRSVVFLLGVSIVPAIAGELAMWPQFRRPNEMAVAAGNYKIAAEIGPNKHVFWKTPQTASLTQEPEPFVRAVADFARFTALGGEVTIGWVEMRDAAAVVQGKDDE
jgi:hypothetical protein